MHLERGSAANVLLAAELEITAMGTVDDHHLQSFIPRPHIRSELLESRSKVDAMAAPRAALG